MFLPRTVTNADCIRTVLDGRDSEEVELTSSCHEVLEGQHALIGFQILRKVKPKSDDASPVAYVRYEPVADAVLYLSDLFEEPAKAKEYDLKLIDQAYPRTEYQRATIRVKYVRGSLQGAQLVGKFEQKEYDKQSRIMGEVINRHYASFMTSLKPSTKYIERIHVPRYPTSTLFVPASMFSLELPRLMAKESLSQEQTILLKRCFDIALDMDGISEQEFISVVRDQVSERGKRFDPTGKFNYCCKVFFDTCCLVANLCDYKSDLSTGQDCERFIVALRTLTGDCEDLGHTAYVFLWIFYKTKTFADPLLQEVGRIAKLFVPGMITGEATLRSMKKDVSVNNCDEYDHICHIYGCASPRWFWKKRYRPNIACTTPDPDVFIKSMYGNNPLPPMEWEEGNVRPWILEGTNWFNEFVLPVHMMASDPTVKQTIKIRDKSMQEARRSIEKKFPSMRRLGVQIQQQNHQADSYADFPTDCLSEFYRRPITFWTEVLLEWGVMATDFTLCADGVHYGVDFKDWMFTKDTLSIVPSFKYDKHELEIARKILDQQRPVVLPKTYDYAFGHPISELDELKQLYPPPLARQFSIVPPFTSYRLNHVSKLSPQLFKELREILHQKEAGYYALDYHHYNVIEGELTMIEIKLFRSL